MVQRAEIKIAQDATELILEDGFKLEKQIRDMKEELENQGSELNVLKKWSAEEIKKRDDIIDKERLDNKKERKNLMDYAKFE